MKAEVSSSKPSLGGPMVHEASINSPQEYHRTNTIQRRILQKQGGSSDLSSESHPPEPVGAAQTGQRPVGASAGSARQGSVQARRPICGGLLALFRLQRRVCHPSGKPFDLCIPRRLLSRPQPRVRPAARLARRGRPHGREAVPAEDALGEDDIHGASGKRWCSCSPGAATAWALGHGCADGGGGASTRQAPATRARSMSRAA